MARQTVWLCDFDQQADDTVKTYTVQTDDQRWEVDLCDKHAAPILKLLQKGREISTPGRGRDQSKTLDGMVRGLPDD